METLNLAKCLKPRPWCKRLTLETVPLFKAFTYYVILLEFKVIIKVELTNCDYCVLDGCDNIKQLITLSRDYIERLSLYVNEVVRKWRHGLSWPDVQNCMTSLMALPLRFLSETLKKDYLAVLT